MGNKKVTEIGIHIKALRNMKGYSIREMAKLAGISHSELSRIESGKREKPSAKMLYKLAKPLGTSQEKLLAVAGYIPRHEAMAAHDLSNYKNITPDMQKFIRKEVERLWNEKGEKQKE